MLTRNDVLDAVRRHLAPVGSPGRPSRPAAAGRPFLTEHDVKKALTPGAQHLKITKDAIVSPLAQDWLALKGIRIIRA